MKYFLLFTIIISSIVAFGESIQCYECNSSDNKKCDDPFEKEGITLRSCENHRMNKPCMKSKTISTLDDGEKQTTIMRGCAEGFKHSEKQDMQFADGEMHSHFCTSELCNGVSKINPTTAVFLTLFSFIFLIVNY